MSVSIDNLLINGPTTTLIFGNAGWPVELRSVSTLWRDAFDRNCPINTKVTKKYYINEADVVKIPLWCGLKFRSSIPLDILYRIHTLDLSDAQVTDVSMLGGVHTLNLSHTRVTDVSKLGGVYKLYLRYTRVTDVSMLGNVHTLNLGGTPVTDVSKLGGVHSLDLDSTPVTDVSMLGNVHNLDLTATKVTDVSMLGGVRRLWTPDGEFYDSMYI